MYLKEKLQGVRTHLGASVAAVLICAIAMTGCTPAQQQTTVQVVTEINTHIPEVVAAAGTVAATVSALVPTDAAIIGIADTAFTAGATTLQALTAAYLKNPTASVLAQIQSAITTLESQINTATLNAVGIKDTVVENAVLAALKGLLTVVTVVFALIAPTLSTAQLMSIRESDTIHLAKLRPYMDQRVLQQEADAQGIDLNKAFRHATAAGF
jgi:hypothetical protein